MADTAEIEEFAHNVVGFMIVMGQAVLRMQQGVISTLEAAEHADRRAQLLAAYRRRKEWKKSDVAHLRSLGVNSVALKRIEKLDGKGRPVVRPYRPPLKTFFVYAVNLQPLFSVTHSPAERQRAFKLWQYWKHHVEALYRGEHALAQEQGHPGASDCSERRVGRALGISAAKVHAISGDIRRLRAGWDGAANFPPMRLAQFEEWMQTGHTDWMDRE